MCPIGAVLCQWNFLDDHNIIKYASDTDTYIRKNAYLAIGNIYVKNIDLREKVIITLNFFLCDKNEKVRQTIVYSLGEIGKTDFNAICDLLSKAIHDPHPSVRNAVVGSLKKTGQRNPAQTIKFAEKYLHHDDPKIRREIIHGIELRGRTHPEDILPLLCEVQNDNDKDIKKIIIHVLGQISYKKGCLEK